MTSMTYLSCVPIELHFELELILYWIWLSNSLWFPLQKFECPSLFQSQKSKAESHQGTSHAMEKIKKIEKDFYQHFIVDTNVRSNSFRKNVEDTVSNRCCDNLHHPSVMLKHPVQSFPPPPQPCMGIHLVNLQEFTGFSLNSVNLS